MDRSLNDAAKDRNPVHRARTDRQHRDPLDRASACARSARGGPGGVAVLIAALLTGAALAAPAFALETPVATPETGKAEVSSTASIPATKPGANVPGFIVKVGVVERAIEIDWTRARHADVALAAGGTRLAPGADAVIKTLAKDLALSGDKRERYLLIARATDPKPSAADLQLRARIVRNALIAAAGAPQDAIVVASWTGTGDPPGAPVLPGAAGSGLILAPIQATGDGAQTRALALDSAFAGIAELIPPGGVAATPRPPAPSTAPAPIATPTPPVAPSVAPPAAIATPRPPEAPKPSVAVAPPPSTKPAPAPPAATTVAAPQAKPATAATPPSTAASVAASALAALVPLPKARPAAPSAAAAPKTAVAPSAAPRTAATSTPPPAAKPTRMTAVERPEAPAKPRVTTPRPPVAKAEPPRRPPTRVADCAPPRVILDDFYPGGPIIACDGSRR